MRWSSEVGEIWFVDAVAFGNFDLEKWEWANFYGGSNRKGLSFGNYFSAVLDVPRKCPLNVFGHRWGEEIRVDVDVIVVQVDPLRALVAQPTQGETYGVTHDEC